MSGWIQAAMQQNTIAALQSEKFYKSKEKYVCNQKKFVYLIENLCNAW